MNAAAFRARFSDEVRALGVVPGGIVSAHCTLIRLVRKLRTDDTAVDGKQLAETVVDGLLDAVGAEGTLVVPTHTGRFVQNPNYPPRFDPRTDVSWTGAIAEAARVRPGALRSRHATHSVAAIGPRAAWLIEGHEYCASPCASDSPWGKLADAGGQYLCFDSTAFAGVHYVSEIAGTWEHLQDEVTVSQVVTEDGGLELIPSRLHRFKWSRDLTKMMGVLREGGAVREGMVFELPAFVVDAAKMRELLVPLIRQDPTFLLEPKAREAYVATATE